MRIVGIDPSLTSTAVCDITDGTPKLALSRTKPDGQDALSKLRRMQRQAAFVAEWAIGADLVMIEAPSLASVGRATRDLAGMWWIMFGTLALYSAPIGIVTPSVLKKWVTGAGNADKFRVGQHIAKRWPDVELRGDDQSDALSLASIGLHHSGGLPWAPTAFQTDALAKVEWNTRSPIEAAS